MVEAVADVDVSAGIDGYAAGKVKLGSDRWNAVTVVAACAGSGNRGDRAAGVDLTHHTLADLVEVQISSRVISDLKRLTDLGIQGRSTIPGVAIDSSAGDGGYDACRRDFADAKLASGHDQVSRGVDREPIGIASH